MNLIPLKDISAPLQLVVRMVWWLISVCPQEAGLQIPKHQSKPPKGFSDHRGWFIGNELSPRLAEPLQVLASAAGPGLTERGGPHRPVHPGDPRKGVGTGEKNKTQQKRPTNPWIFFAMLTPHSSTKCSFFFYGGVPLKCEIPTKTRDNPLFLCRQGLIHLGSTLRISQENGSEGSGAILFGVSGVKDVCPKMKVTGRPGHSTQNHETPIGVRPFGDCAYTHTPPSAPPPLNTTPAWL